MERGAPIDRGFFREAEDGATVFFPWGLAHRGYRLTSEAERRKASRAVSLLVGSTVSIGVWIAHVLEPLFESAQPGWPALASALAAPVAVLIAVVAGYGFWAVRFVERFPESDLKFSREQRLQEAAALVSPGKVALFGVVMAGLSALVMWLQPAAWWMGALGVALGLGAVVASALLARVRAQQR